MDQNITGGILAGVLAILVLISGLLISLTGITIDYFLTINLLPVMNTFLSPYFIGFLITASLTLCIIMIIITKLDQQKALIFSLVGYLIGIGIILALFIQLEFIVTLLLGGVGIALSIKGYEKQKIGFSPDFKTGASIAGKIVIFVGIGLFLTTLLITLPNASEYEQNFSKDIIDSFISSDTLNINSQLISAVGKLQKETIVSIQATEEYKKLQSNNDPDFFDFEMKLEEIKILYASDEYTKAIASETEKISSSEVGNQNLPLELPFVKDLAKFAWLIYAILALVSVLFIGEIILKNLSALIFAIISKISPSDEDLTK
jgi:hypothetical protein